MLESPRAIIHFVGGETFSVPPAQAEHLVSVIGTAPLAQLQVGSRVTWINPMLVTYIQMPSEASTAKGDGSPAAALHSVPRLRVG